MLGAISDKTTSTLASPTAPVERPIQTPREIPLQKINPGNRIHWQNITGNYSPLVTDLLHTKLRPTTRCRTGIYDRHARFDQFILELNFIDLEYSPRTQTSFCAFCTYLSSKCSFSQRVELGVRLFLLMMNYYSKPKGY